MSEFRITKAVGEDDMAAAKGLFSAYANWLEEDHGISLTFQNVAEELAGLPGKYAPPMGQIYLAKDAEGIAQGAAAFRPFAPETCEIKRLYVSPEARGYGLGPKLIGAVLKGAREAGYKRAVLDTAGFMDQAQRLYERFGFRDIPKYYDNPLSGIRYMGAELESVDG